MVGDLAVRIDADGGGQRCGGNSIANRRGVNSAAASSHGGPVACRFGGRAILACPPIGLIVGAPSLQDYNEPLHTVWRRLGELSCRGIDMLVSCQHWALYRHDFNDPPICAQLIRRGDCDYHGCVNMFKHNLWPIHNSQFWLRSFRE